MKLKNVISITMIAILLAVTSVTVCGSVSEDVVIAQSEGENNAQEEATAVVIPDGYVMANDGKIIPFKIKEGTSREATWNHETQTYIVDNIFAVADEETLARNKAERAEYDARMNARCEQYYGDTSVHKMWLASHLRFEGEVSETARMLRDFAGAGLRIVSFLSSHYWPLKDSFNDEGIARLKAVTYTEMIDIYEHIKSNDASDRNLGLYIIYDMLGLEQEIDGYCICTLFNDYRWEMIGNAVFYSNLCEVKAELAEINSAVIKSNPDRYGYLALPAVREGALSGDAASVDVVEKIMEKTASDTRFTSASSVSEWISANKDIIDSIEYIIEN